MGKGGSGGKDDPHERAANHASTPLNQLRDPASFGPPPKRTGTFSSDASSPTTAPPRTVYEGSRLTATTGSLGAPLSRAQVEEDKRYAQERAEAQRQEEEGPPVPAGPFRSDTTGLTTQGFAPPPKFRGAGASPSPPAVGGRAPATGGRAPPPSLPPRLPPRQVASPPPPPAYEQVAAAEPERGVLNQGALGRLSAAGVQVPGFDIGKRQQATSPPAPVAAQSPGHLSELQSRFSRLNTSQSPAQSQAAEPATGAGTSWAQKQSALRTASQFHKDPSSVSLSDARSAASTANNFRERHGEQVAGGWKAANGLNAKYGISERFGGGSGSASAGGEGQESGVVGSDGMAKKKPPPPPPAKKPGLGGGGGGAPPPVNWGSRPGMS
jgi:hypothetical protein